MSQIKLYVIIVILNGLIALSAQATDIIYHAPESEIKIDIESENTRSIFSQTTCKSLPIVQDKNFFLRTLAPTTMAYTNQTQPNLYWFNSKPLKAKLLFILEKQTDHLNYQTPLIKQFFNVSIEQAGIQIISLSDYEVSLEENTQYFWSLSLICDGDVIISPRSRGIIKYVAVPQMLSMQLKKSSKNKLPYIYAKNGYWYDTLDLLSQQIEKEPNLRSLRVKLLEQIGLTEVATFDK